MSEIQKEKILIKYNVTSLAFLLAYSLLSSKKTTVVIS